MSQKSMFMRRYRRRGRKAKMCQLWKEGRNKGGKGKAKYTLLFFYKLTTIENIMSQTGRKQSTD